MRKLLPIPLMLLLLASCGRGVRPEAALDELPPIDPDYAGVTVPANIAPLDFSYLGDGPCRLEVEGKQLRAKDGAFVWPERLWRRLMERDSVCVRVLAQREGVWTAYAPFTIYVSRDRIDPYISYRLIPPGYQGWQEMGLYERNLESYQEKAILRNTLTGGNCLNCHTVCGADPSKMLFHARASFGGTILLDDGVLEKLDTKTDSTISNLVYPFWHPDGEHVAFSVNKTLQVFHNADPNRIEVYDEASDVVVYDVKTHTIAWSPLTKSPDRFETFPAFSPDGRWLYFCSAEAVSPMPARYKEAQYGLWRIAFNAADMSFGDKLECVFDAPAMGKSVSFPRLSPDGRFLCFTLHSYGNFSIWHREADLWLADLQEGTFRPLDEVNSPDVESFHSWSSDGRWMVFSSRRDDGLYTRLYLAHADAAGHFSKPFLLPQRNPRRYYKRLMFSYNLPVFMKEAVGVSERELSRTVRGSSQPVRAQ